jgi:hypothetical protein
MPLGDYFTVYGIRMQTPRPPTLHEVFYIINYKNIIHISIIIMVDAGLESSDRQNFIELEGAGKGQLQKQEIHRDIEHEIECPRCYDTMILLSDFDSLYYSCEECGFILYAVKKGF